MKTIILVLVLSAIWLFILGMWLLISMQNLNQPDDHRRAKAYMNGDDDLYHQFFTD